MVGSRAVKSRSAERAAAPTLPGEGGPQVHRIQSWEHCTVTYSTDSNNETRGAPASTKNFPR